ncbi:hypothetical protein QEO94_00490 [Kingella negevensis]|nr:hypothetical protein [Kingella negevensis]MDK4691524.1 hypothetical protein [Kingella negevensis]MDK4693325.1 hypothetical protein [Kingella negevensis]MDK4699625.1 hypothetical protein [Kingella negevensis]WII93379.1 hypothetical protein QEO94_00490 [Kingella negevensis]
MDKDKPYSYQINTSGGILKSKETFKHNIQSELFNLKATQDANPDWEIE